MATGALLLKLPSIAVVSRESETSKLASLAREQGSSFNCRRGESARLMKRRTKWTASVLPRESPLTTVSPPPAIREGMECIVVMRTTSGCGLGVSRYPDFVYNAEGGGGSGKAVQMEDGCWHVQFDAAEVKIPDVGFSTTTLLGIPLPPPIRIQIVPESLEGIVDRSTGKLVCISSGHPGFFKLLWCPLITLSFSFHRHVAHRNCGGGSLSKVEMNFKAKFYFSTGPLYRPPPLIVDTLLTTETTQGVIRGGTGSRLDADGNCKLVGVARLAPINDWFMDNFLMLPSDCLANMAANISFTM